MKIRDDGAESIMMILRAGVVSFLGMRVYLLLLNYPQIGKGIWHISHALTGGVIMILGMLLLVIYEGKNIKKLAINIFGFGLGLFVDETGKYLTRDYNYFFRPTIMMVYIFFIILFLIYKLLKSKSSKVKRKNMGKRELIIKKIVTKKQVMVGLWIYSIYFSGQKLVELFKILMSEAKIETIKNVYSQYIFAGNSDNYLIVIKIFFDVVAAGLFLNGAGYFWGKKRLRGLRFFEYGLYVSIFLVTVFKFYFEQFGAITDLVVEIILLEVLIQYKKEIVKK